MMPTSSNPISKTNKRPEALKGLHKMDSSDQNKLLVGINLQGSTNGLTNHQGTPISGAIEE